MRAARTSRERTADADDPLMGPSGTVLAVAVSLLVSATSACGSPQRSQAQLVREGKQLFEATCAACHGLDLRGTDDGPSFLDPIYAPDHHPDQSFHNAVANGVQQHHWNFGPMPPQRYADEDDVEAIIAYVRSRQRAAGIPRDSTPR